MNNNINLILFDLGGVLFELNPDFMDKISSASSASTDFWQYWLHSKVVKDFEKGRCSEEDFAHGLISDLNLDMTQDEMVEAFRFWGKGLYAGSLELIEDLKSQGFKVGCLSNSNVSHWPKLMNWGLEGLFDFEFSSHLVGAVKPDPAIYEAVEQKISIPVEEILFVDDNQVNVDAAVARNWNAELCKTPAGARTVFKDYGLL